MRLLTLAVSALVFSTQAAYAQSQFIVEVPPGDVSALAAAIEEANGREPGQLSILKVAGSYELLSDYELPSIEAEMAIRGPARFVGDPQDGASIGDEGGGPDRLLHVAPGASLRLDNVEVADFSLAHHAAGLIENEGNLHVKQVQFSAVNSIQPCVRTGCTPGMPLIANLAGGTLHLDQVSVVDSGVFSIAPVVAGDILANDGEAVLTSVQYYSTERSSSLPLGNRGTLMVHNSSFVYANDSNSGSRWLLATYVEGSAEFLNSIISGFSEDVCKTATSIGFNLHDSADCQWSAPGDLVGVPAGLIWRPVESNWDWAEGSILHYALVPAAASAAVDSANANWCNPYDLLRKGVRNSDGNGDGNGGCDRGAVELIPTGLGEGGINGLYYNPEADGHYLYVLVNDYNTLIVWTTFDKDGNQAWVYGTGELVEGRSVIAETYINRNGGFSPDAEISSSEAEFWGTLEVDMTSCTEGLVRFSSRWPEFGSGQFPVARLAYVKQLGCVD